MIPTEDERSERKHAAVPGWIKVVLIAAGAFALLIVGSLLMGHGPGQHGAAGSSFTSPVADRPASDPADFDRQEHAQDASSFPSPEHIPVQHWPIQGGGH